jgi:hypothetical protein
MSNLSAEQQEAIKTDTWLGLYVFLHVPGTRSG